MPPEEDELPSFSPSNTHSTQDLSNTPADPAAQIPPFITGFDNYDFMFADDNLASLVDNIDYAAPTDAPQERRPWSMDVDMAGVNDAAAACCATAGTAEIQHHLQEEEDAQRWFDSWKSDVEQGLFAEVDPFKAPDEKLVDAPAPEDGRPSGRGADRPEVHAAATQPPVAVGRGDAARVACATIKQVEEEARRRLEEEAQRRFGPFMSAVEQDLVSQGINWAQTSIMLLGMLAIILAYPAALLTYKAIMHRRLRLSCVTFSGPDSKGRKPNRRGWKEKNMKGMRAVADSSSRQPPPGKREQQQDYVGLKKTLELDDDGNGNKWRAHEYTPLVPSDDGTNKLVPAEFSLRVEFEVDEPAPSSAASSKRSRTGAPKDGPKIPVKSPVWEHMTRVHVKVDANNADGSQRKKPCYKVMFAICHHCDKVFNADSGHGTNNLSKHLDCCHCNCTHSY